MQEWRNQLGLFRKAFKPLLPSGKKAVLGIEPKSRSPKQTKSSPSAKPPVKRKPPTPEIPCASPSAASAEGISYFHPRTFVRKL